MDAVSCQRRHPLTCTILHTYELRPRPRSVKLAAALLCVWPPIRALAKACIPLDPISLDRKSSFSNGPPTLCILPAIAMAPGSRSRFSARCSDRSDVKTISASAKSGATSGVSKLRLRSRCSNLYPRLGWRAPAHSPCKMSIAPASDKKLRVSTSARSCGPPEKQAGAVNTAAAPEQACNGQCVHCGV